MLKYPAEANAASDRKGITNTSKRRTNYDRHIITGISSHGDDFV